MNIKIESYHLPPEIISAISALAERADALFIGEVHGTREVPQIVASLLSMLRERNYVGLGVELPYVEQDSLDKWLSNKEAPIPQFYAKPGPDGRGSLEMLALLRKASELGFRVFCFDAGFMRTGFKWTERDAEMAQRTVDVWSVNFPNRKILLICGSNHAYLKPPPSLDKEYWPSFAVQLSQLLPEKRCFALEFQPLRGEFYNFGVKRIDHFWPRFPDLSKAPQIEPSEQVSLLINFPNSTAATFIEEPKLPSQLQLYRLLFSQFMINLKVRLHNLYRTS